ncbi:GNAT family N-acetyltransferase [Actinopolymorpha sp. B17G11]|uniref:GNAT family N-acetyltransferase n=1 Tax=Actinopolymorpha sp. B17G11 TaxID=3160861 RepID=UPI0032E50533
MGVGIDEAIEVFVRGFSFKRSRTHPYVPERIGPAWVMRDAPRGGKAPTYRREEWVAWGIDAADLHALAAEHTRGRYAICAIRAPGEAEGPLRQAYKQLGYRLGATEALMVHRLDRIPRTKAPARITRVTTPELAGRLARATESKPLEEAALSRDAPLRQYVALDGDEPVGWVQSIIVRTETSGDAAPMTWCADMFVQPSHRRRGIGRALLERMLRDDRQRGAAAAVLLASHDGAKLYPVMGYDQIGQLYLYSPTRR